MIDLIVSCCTTMADDARQLVRHLSAASGNGPDWMPEAFRNPFWTAGDGSAQAALAMPVSPEFVASGIFAAPVPDYPPEAGIDTAAAERARAALVPWFPPQDETPPAPMPQAATGRLVAVVGVPPDAALPLMGLARIEADE